jgi:protein-disulfide isomerase
MKAPAPLNYDAIIEEATRVGVSSRSLTSGMRAARTDELRQQIRMLSEALGVVATPTYLIGCDLIRGPIQPDALAQARNHCAQAGAARPACCEPIANIEN